ncbi:hypothetical protein [Dokdonia sp. Dokd-P16]|uniref:hypothetical protein n=1 Tax=Dokdonia sp. Dokd-P16 TaxID=2173169 RepID=UPI0013A59B8D|nr:hypothetical protein [Dokdonia sp. Dokd-P16]
MQERGGANSEAPLRRGVWGDVGSKLLTQTQNISSQPLCIPLGRSFLVGCKKEEEQKSEAPLGKGVWGDVGNSKNLSSLRMNGRHIWGDVDNKYFKNERKKQLNRYCHHNYPRLITTLFIPSNLKNIIKA